ncbi:hypothetical protein, partial [Lacticaseibacillus rhamnosus]|uniref:hypothetical protein n=1 Tax=Lacticaseibacillus rhamnosus TaxID=47715 RepID=UPI0034A2C1FC
LERGKIAACCCHITDWKLLLTRHGCIPLTARILLKIHQKKNPNFIHLKRLSQPDYTDLSQTTRILK